ncbi:MAG: DUF4012 domain-containing protein [Patescibacteria group bacterium]
MNFFHNLLSHMRGSRWDRTRQVLKRSWHYSWPVLTGLAALLLILGLWFGPPARAVYREALAAKGDMEKAKTYLVSQDFTEGQLKLSTGRQHLETAQVKIGKLRPLRSLPFVGANVKAIDELLAAGIATTAGMQRLSTWAETVVKPFKTGKSFSLSTLKPEEKRNILKAIYQAQPDLQAAKASLDLAVSHLEAIPKKGLLVPIAKAVAPFHEQLPALQNGITQAIPASTIIPSLLGYPEQQNYLFLLQNNTELRPTGGFIGTYGVIKVKDGEITLFATDNVYNLDDRAKALNVKPPAPLTRYNWVNRWLFRDSNWSPDFPTAAQEALSFYRREGGHERSLNGVIAIDPTFFQQLLTLTGPITIGKKEFNSKNLVDELQFITGYAYDGKNNIDTTQRKEIIGVLGKRLIEQVLKLPKEKYGKAWTIFQQGVSEKHLIFWVANQTNQRTLEQLGWAGAVKIPQGDSLMVVDANLASLKSDPFVERTLTYIVQRDEEGLIANLTIHYNNTGKLTWKTTRYRTYTRVLVPRGSTLISSTGAMVECNVKRDGTVEVGEEAGHTTFAAFTCTELGASHDLVLRYRLGGSPNALFDQGEYKLLVQKQAGTINHTLNVSLDLGRNLSYGGTLAETMKLQGNKFSDATTLRTDQSYQLTF